MSTAPTRGPRALSCLAVTATVALTAAACSSSGSATKAAATSSPTTSSATNGASSSKLPHTLVFSPLALSPPALKGLSEGVTGIAKSQGWTVIVQDPNFNPNTQQQQLTTVLGSRAGAAWVLANDPKSFGATIKAAQAKGVPILVNGTPSEYGFAGPQPGVTFDYVDYTKAGTALGDQMGKCLVANKGGKGDVLFAESEPGQAGKADFEAAAVAALKATAPGASVVQSLVVSSRSTGQTDIGNALQGHPNVVGVMASTDEGTLGAQGAFSAAGKTLSCNVNFGGDAEVLKDVQAGTVYASVALQFDADTAQSFNTLVKMQADPHANGLVLTVPQKIITKA